MSHSHSFPRVLAELRGASKRYGKLTALDGVDLQVGPGEVLALLGANGAGKSTALGLLTGRLSVDAGEVQLFGGDPREPAQRRGIGVMLQEASLPDSLRVAEHVRLFSSYYPSPRPLAQVLKLAGLTEFAQRQYGELSGGQQRRVQFALAICGNAPLLFVDEPTVGLDVESRRNFWRVLRELREQGTAIVLTTHYLEEADALADRVLLLADGRVIAEDSPAGIKARVSGKRVLARSRVSAVELASWPEVIAVQSEGDCLEVRSSQVETLLRRWLAADGELADLQVQALSLEEAFVSLTTPSIAPRIEVLEEIA